MNPLIAAMFAAFLMPSCAPSLQQSPLDRPSGYEQYQPPPACGDSSVPKQVPSPLNYDAVRRSASISRPDLVPPGAPTRIAFLWFFIREDGGVADIRLWKTSGSSDIDDLAVELGRQVRWRPARCGGQPVANWYGHPMAVGGS